MENKNQPIHPLTFDSQKDTQNMGYVSKFFGLTKREHFAGLAMQGLYSNPGYMKKYEGEKYLMQDKIIAEISVKMADALLEELSKVK